MKYLILVVSIALALIGGASSEDGIEGGVYLYNINYFPNGYYSPFSSAKTA